MDKKEYRDIEELVYEAEEAAELAKLEEFAEPEEVILAGLEDELLPAEPDEGEQVEEMKEEAAEAGETEEATEATTLPPEEEATEVTTEEKFNALEMYKKEADIEDYLEYDGHIYLIYNFHELGLDSFSECEDYCEERGGHLAVINSEEEIIPLLLNGIISMA